MVPAPLLTSLVLNMPCPGLTVQEVHTDAEVVQVSSSVAESMENLRRLAEERLGKISLDSWCRRA